MDNSNNTVGTIGDNAALSKNANGRLCCWLDPINICANCDIHVCALCWRDPNWEPSITYFTKGADDIKLCSDCYPKK